MVLFCGLMRKGDTLDYTLSTVGTLRDYSGVMVSQSQKIPFEYRTYENTLVSMIAKKSCPNRFFKKQ